MRVIDADEAKEKMKDMAAYSTHGCLLYLPDVLHKIDECQTLNIKKEGTECVPSECVSPVIHAHWIPRYPNQRTGKAYSFKCSKCEKIVWHHRQVSVDDMGYNFCPYCGAKMEHGIEQKSSTNTEKVKKCN